MKYQSLKYGALAALLYVSLLGIGIRFAKAANNVSIGRYVSVILKPTVNQQYLLQQRLQIRFPHNIVTIKQAIDFILQFSGYRLVNVNDMRTPAQAMLQRPLPEVDKTFGPMTLKQGLMTLAGKPFYLLVDPVHRLIAFKLRSSYRDLYEKPMEAKTRVMTKESHDGNNK